MKALTVWNPWAMLIAAGFKPFEFRGWKPPASIVGQRIAIHAGARKVKRHEVDALIAQVRGKLGLRNAPCLLPEAATYLSTRPLASYPYKAIVCTARLGEPIRGDEAAERMGCQVNDSDRAGTFNWAWPMLDIAYVPSVPCRGAQGLWNVPEPVVQEIT